MSELPEGWASCQLGDLLCHIQAGKSVKCDERPPEGNEPGLVKISAVTWGEFDEIESKTLLTAEGLDERNRIRPGDLLISRANTLELVGAPVIVQKISKNLYLSDKVLRLELPESLREWALICLRSESGRAQIESLATGNQLSMRNISQDALRAIEMPLPPEAEQKRIARKLDALLAQVDAIRARIDAIPVLLKRFRQAVRVVALAGELERGKMIDSVKWKSCVLSDIALVETGKTPDRSEPKYWTNGSIAWVTSAATGASTCEEAKEFVTHQAAKECNLKIFAPETLLLAMYGEGKTRGQVTELRIHAACNQACAAISVDKNLAELGFVKLRLEENYEEIRKMAAGGAQPNLNLGKVREVPISLPPKEIQADIVGCVDQLFTFAGQLEAQALAAKKRIDALTQSILAKAFRGELVPQDPNDEPASVLLERIRARRAAAPKPKRGRKAAEN